jgi:hypothetical protein
MAETDSTKTPTKPLPEHGPPPPPAAPTEEPTEEEPVGEGDPETQQAGRPSRPHRPDVHDATIIRDGATNGCAWGQALHRGLWGDLAVST